MALFTNPNDHALNPPSTWEVRKVADRVWALTDAYGEVLDRFKTRREAEEAKVSGFLVKLYNDEGRCFAGLPVNGWKPYVPKETK